MTKIIALVNQKGGTGKTIGNNFIMYAVDNFMEI